MVLIHGSGGDSDAGRSDRGTGDGEAVMLEFHTRKVMAGAITKMLLILLGSILCIQTVSLL